MKVQTVYCVPQDLHDLESLNVIWCLVPTLLSTLQPNRFYFSFRNIPHSLHMLFVLPEALPSPFEWQVLSLPLTGCVNLISTERSSLMTVPKLAPNSPSSAYISFTPLDSTWNHFIHLLLAFLLVCLLYLTVSSTRAEWPISVMLTVVILTLSPNR